VKTLEHPLCVWAHPITNRRPWLWLFPHCPFTHLSVRLDERWRTGYWFDP
jgi:hypothetical protein